MKTALKVGLAYGLVSVLVTLAIWLLNSAWLFSFKLTAVSLIIGTAFIIYFGRKYFRHPEDGSLSYGEALKKTFVALLAGFALGMIISIVLYGNNASMKEAYEQFSLETQMQSLALANNIAGGTEADLEMLQEELLEDIENGDVVMSPYPYSMEALPLTLMSGIFFNLILALIYAIFIKKTSGI